MLKDEVGFLYFEEEDILEEIYKNPDIDISKFMFLADDVGTEAAQKYQDAISKNYDEYPVLDTSTPFKVSGTINYIDRTLQRAWRMPDYYRTLDIADWVLGQCKTDAELQRCGEELLLFQERDMFGLLCYLKYFVDTMREHKIVWGVGRGSSVASYVLYLIGVHKVDSLFYQLDIKEFLRDGETTQNSTG